MSASLPSITAATRDIDGIDGNVIGGRTLTAVYDADNHPRTTSRVGAGTTQWAYDSNNARYYESSSEGARYFGAGGYEQVGTKQIHELGPIILTSTGGTITSITVALRDRLGSTIDTIDGGAPTLANARSYDAFGAVRNGDLGNRTGGTLNLGDTKHGFTQHEHADDVRLIHMGGRIYDYTLGRFLNVDPVIGNPMSSQSLNPYSYIGNNPLSGKDPTGYIVETPDGHYDCGISFECELGHRFGFDTNDGAQKPATSVGSNGAVTSGGLAGPGTQKAINVPAVEIGSSASDLLIAGSPNGTVGATPKNSFQQTYENELQGNWLQRVVAHVVGGAVGTLAPFLPADDQFGNTHNPLTGENISATEARDSRIISIISLAAPVAKAVAAEARTGEALTTRVGRWMSPDELAKMQQSGVVQEGGGGMTRVANPASSGAYKNAPAGDRYTEFDVPSNRLLPHSDGTGRIPGPNSPDARVPGRNPADYVMPPATNIKEFN